MILPKISQFAKFDTLQKFPAVQYFNLHIKNTMSRRCCYNAVEWLCDNTEKSGTHPVGLELHVRERKK